MNVTITVSMKEKQELEARRRIALELGERWRSLQERARRAQARDTCTIIYRTCKDQR